jgi:hypothetical protein
MTQRLMLLVFCALLAASPTIADDPSGAAASRAVDYPNDAGMRLAIEGEGGSGAQPGKRLTQAIARMERSLGKALPGPASEVETIGDRTVASVFRSFHNDPATVHVLLTTDADSAICHMAAPIKTMTKAALVPALETCAKALAHPAAAASSAPAPDSTLVVALLAPPRFAGNWSKVDGVFFRGTTTFGVGGMVIIDYEPLVLFNDGIYLEIGEAALEDIDLAAERKARPKWFGRWSRSGTGYVLTGADGKPRRYELQDGSFFKAFPADQGTALSVPYERISGGGNTALGGETMIAVSRKYSFTPDGQFSVEGSVGASTSGDLSGVASSVASQRKMTAPGRYILDRHTLTLIYPDGGQERHFFAFASKKNPPVLDTHMIFIDDSTFLSDD